MGFEHPTVFDVRGPLPTLLREYFSLHELLEGAVQSRPAPVEASEIRNGAVAQHQALQCLWFHVSPVAAVGEVYERWGETVAADVAGAPDAQARVLRSVLVAQQSVDRVAELPAAGVAPAVGTNQDVPRGRIILPVTLEA